MYAADELYTDDDIDPFMGPDPDTYLVVSDECVDDGDGYCETHGGALLAYEEDCSRILADAWLR